MTQDQFLYNYNMTHREKFNPAFFERDDMKLVETMKKLLLSCQRDGYFTIKINSFDLILDYAEIMQKLREYEQAIIDRKKSKNKTVVNKYDSLPINDSDVMLLVVNYYIAVNDGKGSNDTLSVYILLPRIVDKYYYRINGKMFSAIFQIVDGSTYNNNIFSAKIPTNTFKTIFSPCKVYKYSRELYSLNGQQFNATLYAVSVFEKVCLAFEYLFAKFGLEETLKRFNMYGLIEISKTRPSGVAYDDQYIFENSNVYIAVPKQIFDNNKVVQSVIATLDAHLSRNKSSREKLYSIEYWIEDLSTHFVSKGSIEKGLEILYSFENIYDLCNKESLRLPNEDKEDMYDILKWLICEFDELMMRDVIDVSMKKIRMEEYIATMYTSKIIHGIYRSAHVGNVTVNQIKRWINTVPDFLLTRLASDKLVPFRNNSNDIDSFTALKYSYKGISGLGEKKGSAIPKIFKQLDYSSLGRTDPDSSSNTDPGITGILCPLGELHDNYFSDYQEPNNWNEDFEALKRDYLDSAEKIQAMVPIGEYVGSTSDKLDLLMECSDMQIKALGNMVDVDEQNQFINGMVIRID